MPRSRVACWGKKPASAKRRKTACGVGDDNHHYQTYVTQYTQRHMEARPFGGRLHVTKPTSEPT
ncbi:MAG: hypothetical protein CML57_03160 [Rhodobacteraceae bacterium]|nr:hypothetical protein [Paracoccaceae bacterium]